MASRSLVMGCPNAPNSSLGAGEAGAGICSVKSLWMLSSTSMLASEAGIFTHLQSATAPANSWT